MRGKLESLKSAGLYAPACWALRGRVQETSLTAYGLASKYLGLEGYEKREDEPVKLEEIVKNY